MCNYALKNGKCVLGNTCPYNYFCNQDNIYKQRAEYSHCNKRTEAFNIGWFRVERYTDTEVFIKFFGKMKAVPYEGKTPAFVRYDGEKIVEVKFEDGKAVLVEEKKEEVKDEQVQTEVLGNRGNRKKRSK